ncbi:TSUP family transporter, partial [Streptomyces sp. NPDC000151]|uniref:TSUP family transporter n=1 Tax=Streptomyces sp. NPDC000151 TaxID=3154244 RepID=UPI00332569F5
MGALCGRDAGGDSGVPAGRGRAGRRRRRRRVRRRRAGRAPARAPRAGDRYGSMTGLILALVAGAVVGLALGALGGGGSVLAVPALIYLLGFTPAAATTASLLIVTVTSLTALYAHARAGHVRWRAGALFAAAGL